MKRILGTRRRRAAVGVIAGASMLLGALGGGATAVAFDQVWVLTAGGGCGLWDDAPGAGFANDSGFVWVRNTVAASESCTWNAAGGNIATNAFPQVSVRLAVNDSSGVTVQVWNAAVLLATVSQTGNNQFVTLAAALPPNQVITRVSLTIDDTPNPAVLSQRSSGLVDYIRIGNPANGAVGWVETFTSPL